MSKKTTSENLVISRSLLMSAEFRGLPKASTNLYFAFLMKRQMKSTGRPGKEKWVIKNNGAIIFTYSMANKELGMNDTAFRRSLDQLIG